MGYGKVFGGMYTGSLLGAGPVVFALWPYVIANAGADHRVEINPDLVAYLIGCEPEDIEKALVYLMSPDPKSRSEEHEGRRLLHEGAFTYFVVNHAKYREMVKNEREAELNRKRVARHREKRVGDEALQGVTERDAPLRSVTKGAKRERVEKEEDLDLGFEDWWVAYPQGRRVKKAKARVTWGRMTLEERVKALAALGQHTEMWEREGRPIDKIPHPTTWLNARQWEDEIPDPGQYREKRKGGSVDMNVGKRVDPEESEKRRRKVRAAILQHWKHLKELEVEPELAVAVSVALDELGKLADNKAGLREGELGEAFGLIHDRMLDAMVDHVMTSEEVEKMREWVKVHHATHEAAKNALGAHLRKAVRERVGVNDICEYDWEG